MQDIDNPGKDLRNPRDDARPLKPGAREGAYASIVRPRAERSRPDTGEDASPLSDALGLPTLIGENGGAAPARGDVAAPLSDTLHIPTLIGDNDAQRPSDAASRKPDDAFAEAKRSRDSTARTSEFEPRATTPAARPREDAATLIGVPSNHMQTPAGGRLAKLDRVALALGAVIVIGPLFAAMVGRSMG